MTFRSTRNRLKALQDRLHLRPLGPAADQAHAAAIAAEIEWAQACTDQVLAASRRGELVNADPAGGVMTLTGGRIVALPKKRKTQP